MSHIDPDAWTTDVVLADGQTLHLRPIRPSDHEAVRDMWGRLSAETIRLRFFGPLSLDEAMLRHLVDVDFSDRFALVAELRERIIAVARFDRLPEDPHAAEFAITVEDAEQGRGIGTSMLRALLPPARAMGITEFHGDILKSNASMLKVMRDAGFEPALRDYGDMVTATFTTRPTERLLERAGELERRAARNALAAVFSPASVAVVGASRNPRSIGALVLSNLLRGGFTGAVYPVNPHAPHVQSVAAYPTLADCPTVPDTVFVCVPAVHVEAVVDEAGRLGVKAAVLVGTGFSEAGDEGAQIQARVVATARAHGIRLLGPNCMGVLNASEAVRMNGTFATDVPAAGRVGFSSQSGALGMAILAAARRSGLGLSTFASIGNKADISSNDLLQYWEADPDTDVIVLYLESFGNPRTFARIARRIARHKPIVAVKGGRRGTDDRVVEAMFEQTGVVRVPTLEQMFTVTSLLASQPLPAGDRVGIVSNGVGPALLAADACEANGLTLPTLPGDLADRLARDLPLLGTAGNPVVLGATASAGEIAEAVRALGGAGAVDALLVVFTPPVWTPLDDFAEGLASASAGLGVPLVAVAMTTDDAPEALRRAGIPSVSFPEGAADALGHVVRHARWRRRPLGNVVSFDDVDDAAARRLVAAALRRHGEGWMGAEDAVSLLAQHGIPCADHRIVSTAAEAAAAQEALGGPVVVKPAAAVRKTELGAVRLGLSRPGQIVDAVTAMERDLRGAGHDEALRDGWMVQRMVPDGIEVTLAIAFDPTFGPVMHVGLGGTVAELLGDRSVRVLPLTDVDVDDMLRELRGYPLLVGYRRSSPVNVAALRAVLLRLGALVEAHPEVREVELNPVFVRRHDVSVVDARVRLHDVT